MILLSKCSLLLKYPAPEYNRKQYFLKASSPDCDVAEDQLIASEC